MVWAVSTIIATAGLAVTAGSTAYELSSQAGAQSQANKTAGSQLQMEQIQFGEQQQYAKQLQDLINNPSSVTSLPGYKFNFDQGAQAVARQMAASGFLGSGNEATALTQYGQGYAMNTFNQQAQLLAGLAGFNAPAYGSNAVGAGTNAINAQNNSFNQTGSLLASLGYAANRFAPTSSPGSWGPGQPFVDSSGNLTYDPGPGVPYIGAGSGMIGVTGGFGPG